jgi:hypothetical protein
MYPVLILPTGGKGTGVEAQGSNFPFVQPSDDIVGLLADLWLAHENHDAVLPFSVSFLSGFQEAFDDVSSSAQITIVDANGATVFDSPDAHYYWKPFGPRLRVHEWLFPQGAVCRVVQHTAVPEDRPDWPDEIIPVNGVLDERTSYLIPERLLYLSEKNNPAILVTDEIVFRCGYNMDIIPKPYAEPLSNTTALTYNANPGNGIGRYPGCVDPDLVIRRIGGVGPDDQGNFALAADKCYFVRQLISIGAGNTAVPTPGALALGNNCGPCCDCDDFVNVQRAILDLEAKLRATSAKAEATRDEFIVAKERWNAQKECRENIVVQIDARIRPPRFIDFSFGVCNMTGDCLYDGQLTANLVSDPPIPWQIVPGSTYITQFGKKQMAPYKPEQNPNGSYTAHVGGVAAMRVQGWRGTFEMLLSPPWGATITITGEVVTITKENVPHYSPQGTWTGPWFY